MKEEPKLIPFHEATAALNWALVIPSRVAGTLSYTVLGRQGQRYHFMSRGREFVLEFGHDFAAFQKAAEDIYTSAARKSRGYSIVPRVTGAVADTGSGIADTGKGGEGAPAAEVPAEAEKAPVVDEAALERSRRSLARAQRKGQLMRMQPYDLQPILFTQKIDGVGKHAPKEQIVAAILLSEFGEESGNAEGGGRNPESIEGGAAREVDEDGGGEHRTSNLEHPTSKAEVAVPPLNGRYTAESLAGMKWEALKAFAATKGVTAPSRKAITEELLELLAPAPAGV